MQGFVASGVILGPILLILFILVCNLTKVGDLSNRCVCCSHVVQPGYAIGHYGKGGESGLGECCPSAEVAWNRSTVVLVLS